MSNMKKDAAVSLDGKTWLKEVRPLVGGYALHAPVDAMPVSHVVQAWAVLDFLEKRISDRKSELRLRLLKEAETGGKPTDKGGQRLFVDGSTVLRERRISKTPAEDVVERLLAEGDIEREKAFDTRTVEVLNPSKLHLLVEMGLLDGDELEAAKKISWALKVFPSTDLQEVLASATEKYMVGQKTHGKEKTKPAMKPAKKTGSKK
jgi:hypothetical protein